jgi:hypothetical protein
MRVLDILTETDLAIPQEPATATPQQIVPPAQPISQVAPTQVATPPAADPDIESMQSELADIEQASDDNAQIEKIAVPKLQLLLQYATSAANQIPGTVPSTINEESAALIGSVIESLNDQVAHLMRAGKEFIPVVNKIKAEIDKLHAEISKYGQAERKAGGEQVTQKFAEIDKTKSKYAQEIASRLGKSNAWARSLTSALSQFSPELGLTFLEKCATGTALINTFGSAGQVSKQRLSSMVASELQPMFNAENKEALASLIKLPFTETTGFGGGVAPGEALLGCLIPGATSATKGDLSINGETWEVKAGSYGSQPSKGSMAWLDASKEIAPSALRDAFNSNVNKALVKNKTNVRKKIAGTQSELGHLVQLADFRPNKLAFLKTVLEYLKPSQRISAINDVYQKVYPTVLKKRKAVFDNAVSKSVEMIMLLNYTGLSELQVKLSMLEYGIGEYKSPNFIFYNSTTQDVMLIQGLSAISKAFNPKFNIATSSITMGGGAKSSPGVFLKGDDPDEVERIIGFQRKRPKVTRTKSTN